MYIHQLNQEKDTEKILSFIKEHSFGTLVTAPQGIPQASHLPFSLESTGENSFRLTTHMAKANLQWKHLRPEGPEVLVIFQSASAYISPRWYDHINVPTMNYIAIHVYGKPHIIEEQEEVYQILKKQIEQFEGTHTSTYNIDSLPPQFYKKQAKGMVAIQISVSRLEANFKLSQNRDENNYKNIIEELEKLPDTQAQTIAAHMKEVYQAQGYKK
jgi:transcriptional regulator